MKMHYLYMFFEINFFFMINLTVYIINLDRLLIFLYKIYINLIKINFIFLCSFGDGDWVYSEGIDNLGD